MTIEVFIKKPEKVEVLKYDGTNYDEAVKFAGEEFQWIKDYLAKGNYIVKHGDYNIITTIYKPNFAKQDLIGTYNKDAVQGVNPNVHISLEKLQEFFEVPIVDDREKDVNKIASNNCGVKKYQKKLVEAVKCSRDNLSAIMEFTNGEGRIFYSSSSKRDVGVFYTHEKVIVADVGDYIVKDNKGEFYPCKPDVFEATYDEYNEQQDSNHASKPSSFSLRDLVMQFAPQHIKYYIKRLEEYGFKLKCINEALIGDEDAYLPFIFLKDKNCNDIVIVNQKSCYSMSGCRQAFELHMANKIIKKSADGTIFTNDYVAFEVKDNNWREAFNKLVAAFPDEIMKNTNHHASLSS